MKERKRLEREREADRVVVNIDVMRVCVSKHVMEIWKTRQGKKI